MHVVSSTDDQRETVVLLHSSAASARQWDALIAALSGRYLVRAIDLHGHGAGPAWHGRTPFTLADDAALVAPLLVDAGSAHLVGHSYGGAVALKLATLQPRRVKSIVAYEPVLFRTLFKEDSWGLPARDVRAIADLIRDCLRIGKPIEAARRFVDFWSGRGGFDRMAPARQRAIAERMGTVLLHFEALFADAPSTGRVAAPRDAAALCHRHQDGGDDTAPRRVAAPARTLRSARELAGVRASRADHARRRVQRTRCRLSRRACDRPGLRRLACDGDSVDAHHHRRTVSAPRCRSGNRRMR